MTFQLDTSGRVAGNFEGLSVWYEFDDLSPFMQGYVGAAFESARLEWVEGCLTSDRREGFYGFSDLAPATLAAMMADCEKAQGWPTFAPWYEEDGRLFWLGRQQDAYPAWPVLTLTIRDDGKVYQEARA